MVNEENAVQPEEEYERNLPAQKEMAKLQASARQPNIQFPVKEKQEIVPYNKETQSALEKAVIALSEELANVSELKDALEQSLNDKSVADDKFQSEVTAYFNSLRKQFDEFNEKFSREIDYARELDLKIQNNEYRGQIYLLEKALDAERAKITIALDDITEAVKEKLRLVSDKCLELKSADNLIEEAIMKFRSDSMSASENEYRALRQNCEAGLRLFTENAQKTLETVKKRSVDFITQCEKENKALIKNVPSVIRKAHGGKLDCRCVRLCRNREPHRAAVHGLNAINRRVFIRFLRAGEKIMKLVHLENVGTRNAKVAIELSPEELETLKEAMNDYAKDNQTCEVYAICGNLRAVHLIAQGNLQAIPRATGEIFAKVKEWKDE